MFDISTLEVGDIIHFQYDDGAGERGLIANINNGTPSQENVYKIIITDNNTLFEEVVYNESTFTYKIQGFAHWIRKPLLGLELI